MISPIVCLRKTTRQLGRGHSHTHGPQFYRWKQFKFILSYGLTKRSLHISHQHTESQDVLFSQFGNGASPIVCLHLQAYW